MKNLLKNISIKIYININLFSFKIMSLMKDQLKVVEMINEINKEESDFNN